MPKIGLVMSGGFAKGAYQVGVLKAVRDFFGGQSLAYISASSIAVINAFAYCVDKLGVIEDVWRNVEFTGFRSFAKAYMRSNFIKDTVDSIAVEQSVSEPLFYATFLNLSKRSVEYITLNDVVGERLQDFLVASVTLPVFAKAIEIDGDKYVDGALIDNIPVKPLLGIDMDYAIVVHFDNDNVAFENDEFDSKLIKINFLDTRFVKGTMSFGQEAVEDMISTGYNTTLETLKEIFENGFDDVVAIRQKIAEYNKGREKKSFRLTGDVAFNNITKVFKKRMSSSQKTGNNTP
ncbi:MAG: patatin-like phospholipase family protein [Defluviitaleaceae bacterium]|nr:patatin-like phospholipase family protein [Defluviitaleaceae bacterium]